MACGIYIIQNKIDKKKYIGSSINIENREYKHFWMLNNNKHDNKHLQNSYNKFGKDCFEFIVVEECDETLLIERENYYIKHYNSNIQDYGYNLALVNDFRRNNLNTEVKIQLSKYNLNKNGNFSKYSLININTNEEYIFNNLVEGAIYLKQNGFANGSLRNIRMKISNCLRGLKVNNGKNSNGSIRKTCYKHNFRIIN